MAKVHIHHLTEVRELELVRSPKHLTLKLKFTKVCVIKLLVTEYSAVLENVWKETFLRETLGQSTTLIQTKMSQQLLPGLRWEIRYDGLYVTLRIEIASTSSGQHFTQIFLMSNSLVLWWPCNCKTDDEIPTSCQQLASILLLLNSIFCSIV